MLIYHLLLYHLLISLSFPSEESKKSVETHDMRITWHCQSEQIRFKIQAPNRGWVAIGLNNTSGLSGTNLIMGASEHGHFKMSDRYIIQPGVHKSILSLGAFEALSDRNVTEMNGSTIMEFSIRAKSEDHFHHNLIEGEEYFLTAAYSTSDDFKHHSRVRTEIKIKL